MTRYRRRFKVVRWEHFVDAMSTTRLQDEYNNALGSCDFFIALFFTKAGKFTQEEFEIAYGSVQGQREAEGLHVFQRRAG